MLFVFRHVESPPLQVQERRDPREGEEKGEMEGF